MTKSSNRGSVLNLMPMYMPKQRLVISFPWTTVALAAGRMSSCRNVSGITSSSVMS